MTPAERAIHRVLAHEGGYVDHEADRGGATHWGITEGTLERARDTLDDLPEDVAELSEDDAIRVYHRLYWRAAHCYLLPWPTSYVHMDAAVQHGVGRAVRFLQATVGATEDGVWGPETEGRVRAVTDWRAATAEMLARRSLYYIRILADESQAVFARGWANRLQEVLEAALSEAEWEASETETSGLSLSLDTPEMRWTPVRGPEGVERPGRVE